MSQAAFEELCSTTVHWRYWLSCEDYRNLLAEADGRCMLCQHESGTLVIDHDHALGIWAVRGLVCPWCNAALGRVDSGKWPPSQQAAAYIENAWHLPATSAESAADGVAGSVRRPAGTSRRRRDSDPARRVSPARPAAYGRRFVPCSRGRAHDGQGLAPRGRREVGPRALAGRCDPCARGAPGALTNTDTHDTPDTHIPRSEHHTPPDLQSAHR